MLTYLLKKSLVFENTPKNGKLPLEVYYLTSPTPCVWKKSHGGFLRKSGKCKIHDFCHILQKCLMLNSVLRNQKRLFEIMYIYNTPNYFMRAFQNCL